MIKLDDIATLRLRNQRLGLAVPKFDTPEEVVGWMGAVQSQEYALAKWSVGQRLAQASQSAVESAIASGAILRTHILRPTWHFVLPRDIRWITRLTAPRWAQVLTRRNMQLGLEPRDVERALDLIRGALAGGKHLTRPELGAALARGGIDPAGQRLAFLVMAAETSLLVASGPGQTYALLPEDAAAPFDRDASLAELTLRYFTSHGPATIRDFVWWSSLTVADARRGIAANLTLERLTVDGTDYYWAGDTSDGPDDDPPTAHLLQGFDEYIVGYASPREPINLGGHGPHTALNTPSWLNAFIIDGQLCGWWRRVPGKGDLRVETRPLRDLSKKEESALQEAVDRYSTFTH
ncbi:MAG: winged helix DNA-binding domain-containing protein [Chloroflexota bacterium]|nr:winged helix DNA-binding domain-containing protein [Chloroflexota bacterium]